MQPRALAGIAQAKCTIGCHMLDRLLRGGMACGSITELVGQTVQFLGSAISINTTYLCNVTVAALIQVKHLQAKLKPACSYWSLVSGLWIKVACTAKLCKVCTIRCCEIRRR